MRRNLEGSQADAAVSLLFAVGERPTASDIEQLLAADSLSDQGADISYRPDEAEGWLELLASGLTFDLRGLVPAAPVAPPPMDHQFGIALNPRQFEFEGISIAPSPHVSGGGAMLPLVRTMLGLAAMIALPLSVKAVCWHPAKSWMEPNYFTRIVLNWLAGGAFPALGLTAVEPNAAGSLESRGLGFFAAGQEIRVEARRNEPRAETVKLAVRVIDHIIRYGPLSSLRELEGPSGEVLLAEPSHDGRLVTVWRSTS